MLVYCIVQPHFEPSLKGEATMKKLLFILVIAVAVVVGIAALQPNKFSVTRSTYIAAAPAAVFPLVNDLRRWEDWSPWEKIDPAMKKSYAGPAAGKGAVASWAGNYEVGEGKMTITKVQAPNRIDMHLEFFKPMKATNLTEFTFLPDGQGTRATWTMSGQSTLLSKVICLFMNMDRMVGSQFEKGLAHLKVLAEAPAKAK
jgi:hypothetical protein